MRHVIGPHLGGTVFVLLGAFRPPLLRAPTTTLCELTSWAPHEDWALQDRAPQFTIGRGGSQATFWSALTASTPELAGRTPEECERRLRTRTGRPGLYLAYIWPIAGLGQAIASPRAALAWHINGHMGVS